MFDCRNKTKNPHSLDDNRPWGSCRGATRKLAPPFVLEKNKLFDCDFLCDILYNRRKSVIFAFENKDTWNFIPNDNDNKEW